jgi:hypothetical protein
VSDVPVLLMTKQDVFSSAVRGLSNQGWDRCENQRAAAVYAFGDRHSPWGWIDQALDKNIHGSVYYLRQEKIGLAAEASDDILALVHRMELAHVSAPTALAMRRAFRKLAFELSLHWPDDVP